MDELAAARDQAARQVDLHVVELDHALVQGRIERPAQDRPHPRGELLGLERLGEVVVGAEVQAARLVGGRSLRAEQHDRDLAALLELAHDLEPVEVRHPLSSRTMSGRSSSSTASAASPLCASTTRKPSGDKASATCRVTRGSSATRTSGGVLMAIPFGFPVCAPDANRPAAALVATESQLRDPAHSGPNGATLYAVSRVSVAHRPRSPDVLRRVQAPAARHRRGRDPGLARLARPGRRPGGREPGAVPDVQAAQARSAAPRRPAQPHEHALHQHDQPRAGAVRSRATRSSSAGSAG